MAAPDPAGDDLRLAHPLRSSAEAACAICGESDPFALVLHGRQSGWKRTTRSLSAGFASTPPSLRNACAGSASSSERHLPAA